MSCRRRWRRSRPGRSSRSLRSAVIQAIPSTRRICSHARTTRHQAASTRTAAWPDRGLACGALEFGTARYHKGSMKSFGGKVAAITGASSGMGRTLALSLARRGCHLALSDVNELGLVESTKLAATHGVKVTSKKVDVSKREEVYAWADEVVRDHGRCNLIFNNAGVAHSATIEGTEYADFEWIVGINFWGVVYGTKAFLPPPRASGEGHVVNTSSLFGLLSVPGQSTYNATKFAVRGFT